MENSLLSQVDSKIAASMYSRFAVVRYGVKVKKHSVDPQALAEMREVYRRSLELIDADLTLGNSCDITRVEEYLKRQ